MEAIQEKKMTASSDSGTLHVGEPLSANMARTGVSSLEAAGSTPGKGGVEIEGLAGNTLDTRSPAQVRPLVQPNFWNYLFLF